MLEHRFLSIVFSHAAQPFLGWNWSAIFPWAHLGIQQSTAGLESWLDPDFGPEPDFEPEPFVEGLDLPVPLVPFVADLPGAAFFGDFGAPSNFRLKFVDGVLADGNLVI